MIPVDKTLLFTVAGMVPFKSYFTGEETPPYKRAVSVQKCVRAGGKHNDLDDIGRTNRHFSFFEMLGNFSFGDYFKEDAIQFAWDFYTNVLGRRHQPALGHGATKTDDEAERIWRDVVGFPAERIQRLGDDNFWRMGDTGPCGPSSEIFWDLGPEFGPDGGPITEADRYIEIWNLVFMQFDQKADGTRSPLPKPCIDTGAGLERNLMVVQDKTSIWDIDVFQPLLAEAPTGHGCALRHRRRSDISLAHHRRARAHDDVHGRRRGAPVEPGARLRAAPHHPARGAARVPARRARRRHAGHGRRGRRDDGHRVPRSREHARGRAHGRASARRKRSAPRCERGLEMLDGVLERGDVSGEDAFFLHDTLGFPIDLTREIAEERGHAVDLDGFEARCRNSASGPAPTRRASGRRRTTREVARRTTRPSSPAARSTRRRARCWR